MNAASLFLLGVLALLLFVDYATYRRRGARVVLVELAVFALGGILVAFPGIPTRLASLVGIGRGVDFVLYLAVIWLVRESIMTRHARWREAARLTDLARVLAIQSAVRRSEQP
jgi:hypothetical protein